LNQEEIAKFAARIISILVKCGIQYGPKYAVNKMFDNKIKTASKGKFKNISDFEKWFLKNKSNLNEDLVRRIEKFLLQLKNF
jgi:hypothetical protein